MPGARARACITVRRRPRATRLRRRRRRAHDGAARALLDETVLLTGLFALQDAGNQELLHWGTSPTILQRLSNLPFAYYSDAAKRPLLFPTLLAAAYAHEARPPSSRRARPRAR